MKTMLIFLFLTLSFAAFSIEQEIADREDAKAIVSTVKDLEVRDMLKTSGEFKECKEKFKYEGDKKTTGTLDAAVKCFQEKLKGKGDKELGKLADALNLQSYGLVKSKSAKDIQEYLNDKMYHALTGVDPKKEAEKNWAAQLKFKDRKQVDQSVFIKMYKTQLSKNALFEISRYCFQDLRRQSQDKISNFTDHWNGYKFSGSTDGLTDTGEPAFDQELNPDDKDKIYEQLLGSISKKESTPMTSEQFTQFFNGCGRMMVELCEIFKKNSQANSNTSDTDVNKSVGSASCLAKNRIQEIKTAISNAEKVEKQFAEMAIDDKTLQLAMKGEPIKFFEAGKNGNATLDELTSYSSKDLLEGGANSASTALLEECEKNPGTPQCSGLVGDEESFNKAKHDLEVQMTFKREADMERVRKIVKENKEGIKEYLEKNGYYSILNDYNAQTLKIEDIPEMVGKEFEAKKKALIAEMNKKIGSRQAKKSDNEAMKEGKIKDVAKDSKLERARLAQVVMFNNIITSHLSLRRKVGEKEEDVGRNLNPWKKEEQALTAAKIDASLFRNLKAQDDGKGTGAGISGDEQIAGIEFIDTMLGKEQKKEKSK